MSARERVHSHPVEALASTLEAHYGPSGWWPGDSPFEIMIGAILVQNTAWRNVEIAICNLKNAGLLEPRTLAYCRMDRLKRLVRPAGYFNQKSERIRRFARWIVDDFGGVPARMNGHAFDDMRGRLLAFTGIGPETADSILCYALGHPVFVADAYTRRIFFRHGLCEERASYDELQTRVMNALPSDRHAYGELHGHIVFVGKDFCSRRAPDCARCPLNGWHHHDAAVYAGRASE